MRGILGGKMSDKMTIEKAREIVEQGKIQGYATPNAHGFIEGYEAGRSSRDAEVEELKKKVEGGNCRKCGKWITKDCGGTVFTHCEECWEESK